MDMSFWNSKDLDIWNQKLVEYWDRVKYGNLEIEKKLDNLDRNEIKNLTVEEFYNFLYYEYFPWKFVEYLGQIRGYLEKHKNNLDEMRKLEVIHSELFSFDLHDIERGLQIAHRIHGLGYIGASGLLALLFPDYFGTLDKYVIEALQEIDDIKQIDKIKTINSNSVSLNEGVMIIEILREKAKELNEIDITKKWTPRKIDMVLWGTRNTKNKKQCSH